MDKVASNQLMLSSLEVRNFRCFSNYSLSLNSPVVLIEGANGTGKTSLLEALYYSCYLRSFRSGLPRELIKMGQDGFFIKASIVRPEGGVPLKHEVHAAFSAGKRVVSIDQKRVTSYKELMDFVRVISLTDDDISLIKDGPQYRRSFLDRALLLHDPDYAHTLRAFRTVLHNRNALLHSGNVNADMYYVLTQQLWEQSCAIGTVRKTFLSAVSEYVHAVAEAHLPKGVCIAFSYDPSYLRHESFEQFWQANGTLSHRERAMHRSLFGAHLDDFSITFQGSKSRTFASRGQQKLVLLLLKLGQAYHLAHTKNVLPIMILDDFMSDFDAANTNALLASLHELGGQLIFTTPVCGGSLERALKKVDGETISLTD